MCSRVHSLPRKERAGKFRLDFLSFYIGQRHNTTGNFFNARCVIRMGGMRKGVVWKTVVELDKVSLLFTPKVHLACHRDL